MPTIEGISRCEPWACRLSGRRLPARRGPNVEVHTPWGTARWREGLATRGAAEVPEVAETAPTTSAGERASTRGGRGDPLTRRRR